jgi:hypothetical protein
MNKKNKIATGILLGGVLLSVALYAALKMYFYSNPIIICGSDKYSTGCLVSYAADLRLDKRTFLNCMTDNSNNTVLTEDAAAAKILNLPGGPVIFIGQLTDNSSYSGFYASVTTSSELKSITDNVLNNGIIVAKNEYLKIVVAQTNDNVKQFLEGQGYKYQSADYNVQLAKLQPNIDSFFKSFDLFNIKMEMNTIIGDKTSKYALLYFADYGNENTPAFFSGVLSQEITDYVDTNKLALVVKELPVANTLANSTKLANAALCAGVQNKYLEYSNILSTI